MQCLTSTDVFELTYAMPEGAHVELGALTSAVPTARAWARVVLAGWELARLADDTGLVLTELVSNAVLHASGEVVDIWLRSDRRRLVLMVGDPCRDMPVRPNAPNADQLSGRGLMIVSAIAERWGAYRVPSGKVVWAVIVCG